MQITLNGEARALDEGTTLRRLLEQLGLADKRLAVEINGAIVPRSQHAQRELRGEDRVEIVTAIGGG